MAGQNKEDMQGEIGEKSTVRKFRTVWIEGEREAAKNIIHYN